MNFAELVAEARTAFYLQDYAGAATALDGCLGFRRTDVPATVWDEAWLTRVACYALTADFAGLETFVGRHVFRMESVLGRHIGFARGILSAYQGRDVLRQRIAFEVHSQGWLEYPESNYPRLFAELDRRLEDDAQTPYDYSVSSFTLWKTGLRDIVQAQYQIALTKLVDSTSRYALAGLGGDALWSWFDSILCLLLLDSAREARALYETHAASQTPHKSHFVDLATNVLRGYEIRDAALVLKAQEKFALEWKDFAASEYPSIFDRLHRKVAALQAARIAAVIASRPAVVPNIATVRPVIQPDLVVRPAISEDLSAISKIAGHVDMASMRKDRSRNENYIRMSTATLSGALPWQQGLLFLSLEMLSTAKRSAARKGIKKPSIVGNAKLQLGWGGCWKADRKQRHSTLTGGKIWANHDYLVFQANPSDQYGLEFAGIAVNPDHQGKGFSKSLTQARVLFILLHHEELERQIGGRIAYLYSNLLTADKSDGSYPFYELVVRPLFGGLDYEKIDDLRYQGRESAHSPILNEFLMQKGEQPQSRILLHLLPTDVRTNLGKVRRETRGAEKNLLDFGFERTDKYDVLDGGQYYENTVAKLIRVARRRRYLVVPVGDNEIPAGDSIRVTFAPIGRAMKDFRCARTLAMVDGDRLMIRESLFNHLHLTASDQVDVLEDTETERQSQPSAAIEVNFDGLVGPTHTYSSLSRDNTASVVTIGQRSNPRAAALQGLAKMKRLHDLGVPQGVLPPLPRPLLGPLREFGLHGKDIAVLKRAAAQSPDLLAACCSASAMWAANCATATPSCDATDRRVHFTPANLMSEFHRSLETEATTSSLRRIFADDSHFEHHAALPRVYQFGDEGAANHIRFSYDQGRPGVHLFVYGRDNLDHETGPRKYIARQARQACEAICSQHGIPRSRVVFAQQNPDVIDAGIFHNDLIATGHRDLFFYHSLAYVDSGMVVGSLSELFKKETGHELRLLEVTEDEVSLADVRTSYLFNSQIVTDGDGRTALIAPKECDDNERVRRYLDRFRDTKEPFHLIETVNLSQGMANGGGPACLRLRVVLTESERLSVKSNVFLTDQLYDELKAAIEETYPEDIVPADLADPKVLARCNRAYARILAILRLA